MAGDDQFAARQLAADIAADIAIENDAAACRAVAEIVEAFGTALEADFLGAAGTDAENIAGLRRLPGRRQIDVGDLLRRSCLRADAAPAATDRAAAAAAL